MKIDNSISIDRIKKTLTPKTIVIVLLTVFLLSAVFYITLENRDSEEILIWFVTTESDDYLSDEALQSINSYGAQRGMDKILLTRRHPEDMYFDVLMSTGAYYSCDIFIMTEEIVQKYAPMDIFLPFSTDAFDTEDLICVGDEAVGILLKDGYYMLINAHTDADIQIIYDIIDILKNSNEGK